MRCWWSHQSLLEELPQRWDLWHDFWYRWGLKSRRRKDVKLDWVDQPEIKTLPIWFALHHTRLDGRDSRHWHEPNTRHVCNALKGWHYCSQMSQDKQFMVTLPTCVETGKGWPWKSYHRLLSHLWVGICIEDIAPWLHHCRWQISDAWSGPLPNL